MGNSCEHCDKHYDGGHSITVYDKTGGEERFEVVCDSCYEEWLHSLKG